MCAKQSKCACVCVRERERERKRKKERERETNEVTNCKSQPTLHDLISSLLCGLVIRPSMCISNLCSNCPSRDSLMHSTLDCYVILCYVMLCYVMLCDVIMLYYALLSYEKCQVLFKLHIRCYLRHILDAISDTHQMLYKTNLGGLNLVSVDVDQDLP